MNNKAFTLIELLAILVILTVISIIVVPAISESINMAKESTYDNQVNVITTAAESYFIDSSDDISDKGSVIYLSDILKSGYIGANELINPIDGKEMTGCVLVTLSSNQYHYKYITSLDDCQKYPNLSE